jgi:hypothetical protein
MPTATTRPETTGVASGRGTLLTARYAAVDPRQAIPVQTSVGAPRWVG